MQQHGHLLDRADADAARLERLLIDLLDVDRLQLNAGLLCRLPADLGELAEKVVRTLAADNPRVTNRVAFDVETVICTVDVVKVERIVENLLANALRHTPPDTPVWVELREHDGGGQIRVGDAGPGVPDELKPSLFEPFVQGDRAAASATPGSGIGLALVAQLTRLRWGSYGIQRPAGWRCQLLGHAPQRPTNSGPGRGRGVIRKHAGSTWTARVTS